MVSAKDFQRKGPYLYEVPQEYREDMRVPARFYADAELLNDIKGDKSLNQLVNTATMPGIVKYALAMPDIHQGYGFPIGGVIATELPDGAISPGGVGYDINCGVRLLGTHLDQQEIEPYLDELASALNANCPSGVGKGGSIRLKSGELSKLLEEGAGWALGRGYALPQDLERTESNGCIPGADSTKVSPRAIKRGLSQVGTLGAGNHFIEVDRVDQIFDSDAANRMGLSPGRIVVQVHCGSRGFGHQVCTDYVRRFQKSVQSLGIRLPDRELVFAPLSSPEGQDYLAAMSAAANYAFANRGQLKEVCVHRKGATRAFGPGSADLPEVYRDIGQPVLVPGSMGTASWVLLGTAGSMEMTFGSTCHGAGRTMSRRQAKRNIWGGDLLKQLEESGIHVRAGSLPGLAEEAPTAYKDVDRVVNVVHGAGIAKKVARIVPVAVIKG